LQIQPSREVPADDLVPLVVQQDDRAVAAIDVSLHDALPPVPQVGVLGDPAAKDDVPELGQTRELAHAGLVAEAILDHRGLALEPAHLAERSLRDPVYLDEKSEALERIVSLRRRHGAVRFDRSPTVLR
jgi:hypothetical protein